MLYFKAFPLITYAVLLLTTTGGAKGKAASEVTKQDCEQNGYKQHGKSCYKLHDTGVTWDLAKDRCAAEGAYLVVINDNVEADIVSTITKDSSFGHDWVGLRDEGNNNWRSVNGDQINNIYNVWAESERHKYKCAALKFTGELDDVPCTNAYSFVCEK